MKTIIKHGYNRYQVECHKCKCIFDYELEDIKEEVVTCPECGSKCLHFSSNYLMMSQIEDDE